MNLNKLIYIWRCILLIRVLHGYFTHIVNHSPGPCKIIEGEWYIFISCSQKLFRLFAVGGGRTNWFDSQIGQFIAKLRNVNRRFSKGQSKLSLRRMAKIESYILLKSKDIYRWMFATLIVVNAVSWNDCERAVTAYVQPFSTLLFKPWFLVIKKQ